MARDIYIIDYAYSGIENAYADKGDAVAAVIKDYFERCYPTMVDYDKSDKVYTVAEQVKDDMISLISDNFIEDYVYISAITLNEKI